MSSVRNWFKSNAREMAHFERVTEKRSLRPDVHAFLLLDELVPPRSRKMVCWGSHDEIHLDVTVAELEASAITLAQVIELLRCGVFINNEEYLSLF